MVISPDNKYLYFGTQEGRGFDGKKSTTGVYRLRIKKDGSAGKLQKIADFGEYAMNGISFDLENNRIIVVSPFIRFYNGVTFGPNFDFSDRGTKDVQTAGGVWVIYINDKYNCDCVPDYTQKCCDKYYGEVYSEEECNKCCNCCKCKTSN